MIIFFIIFWNCLLEDIWKKQQARGEGGGSLTKSICENFSPFFSKYDSLILKTDYVSLWRGWENAFFRHFLPFLFGKLRHLCYTHLLMLHTSSERFFGSIFFWFQDLFQFKYNHNLRSNLPLQKKLADKCQYCQYCQHWKALSK